MLDKTTYAKNILKALRDEPAQFFRPRTRFHCPVCDYEDYFLSMHKLAERRCPNCSSKERDRKICGRDHKRNYGLDFADKLRAVGFMVRPIETDPEEEPRHRL